MNAHECATGCGRPAPETTICEHCAWQLERDLGDVAALSEELDTALARQVRLGGGSSGRRGAEKPLPYSPEASEAASVLASALIGWVRDLADDVRRWTVGGPLCEVWCDHPSCRRLRKTDFPIATPPAMAAWLLVHLPAAVVHPAAGELYDEVTSAVANVRRTIDRAPVRIFAGRCGEDGCDGQVYGKSGKPTARCPQCGYVHDLDARRQAMLDDLEDRLFTAAEIAMLATYLGEAHDRQRTRKLLNVWAERGQLHERGLDKAGRPTYRFGDAMDRLLSSVRRAV